LLNNLPEFPAAALPSIDVATATPHSFALQPEKFILRYLAENQRVNTLVIEAVVKKRR
jgi:hypothetical protein